LDKQKFEHFHFGETVKGQIFLELFHQSSENQIFMMLQGKLFSKVNDPSKNKVGNVQDFEWFKGYADSDVKAIEKSP
jgi:hypothetical protein